MLFVRFFGFVGPFGLLSFFHVFVFVCGNLETNMASRWKGVRLPPSFWEVPQKFPKRPRKFPKLPRKFPKLPRKFPDFPGGQALSLGNLTPSPDSQKLSLSNPDVRRAILSLLFLFNCNWFFGGGSICHEIA